jgi:hypothetical protein
MRMRLFGDFLAPLNRKRLCEPSMPYLAACCKRFVENSVIENRALVLRHPSALAESC